MIFISGISKKGEIAIKEKEHSASADDLCDFSNKNDSAQNAVPGQPGKAQDGAAPKIKLAEGLKMRKVADQMVLIPVGKAVKTIRHSAVLNKEAARLVSLMTGEFTEEEIVQKGMTIYNVEESVLRKDVKKIITVLKQAGMMTNNIVEDKNGTKSISGTIFLPKKKGISDPGSL